MNFSQRRQATQSLLSIINRHNDLLDDPVQQKKNAHLNRVLNQFTKELGFRSMPSIFDSSGLGLPWHAAKVPKWMNILGVPTSYIFVDYNFLTHKNAPPLALEAVIAHELGHLVYCDQGKWGHDFKNRNLKEEQEADAVAARLVGQEAMFDTLLYIMVNTASKASTESNVEIVTRQRTLAKRCDKTAAKYNRLVQAALEARDETNSTA